MTNIKTIVVFFIYLNIEKYLICIKVYSGKNTDKKVLLIQKKIPLYMKNRTTGSKKKGVSKKAGVLSCSIVEARTKIKRNGITIIKGTAGNIELQRKTKHGYGRATVRFKGASKPIEVETSKIRCV